MISPWGYATRSVDRLVAQAARYGESTGIYVRRLDGDQPWMMRSAYRLIGLAKRYGAQAAEAACGRALDVDVINVSKIESMLKNGERLHSPILFHFLSFLLPSGNPLVAAAFRFCVSRGAFRSDM